ncbi:MAG: efflux RND transporter permease subunit, partial [Planctomycetes bacterium]|nr:efflux RND transporter permease subunit [Planctomycetota bacterium]
ERIREQQAKAPAAGQPDLRQVQLADRSLTDELPDGIELALISDQSRFIQGSIDEVEQATVIGGVLALLVLFVFLRELKSTLIIGFAIPISVIATFVPLFMRDISLNIMSLGGLALGVGMLVDSSIVVLEAIFRRSEEGEGGVEAVVLGASEVGGAVFASTLTTVAVFFPIVFVEGIAGQIFRDQAMTVVYSLLASLAVALTLIPMLAFQVSRFRRSEGGAHDPGESRPRLFWSPTSLSRIRSAFSTGPVWRRLLRVSLLPYYLLAIFVELVGYALFGVVLLTAVTAMTLLRIGNRIAAHGVRFPLAVFAAGVRGVESLYLRALRASLAHRGAVLAMIVAVLSTAWWVSGELGSELIPEVAQGEFIVHLRLPVGTPIDVTSERAQEFEARLADVAEIASVTTTVGVDPEDVTATDEGEHTARFLIRLSRSRENLDEVERRVQGRVFQIFGGVGDHSFDIAKPVLFSFRTPIEVEVRGHRLDELHRLAHDVAVALEDRPGIQDVRSTAARGSPEYHLYPDRERMMRFGVSGAELAQVLSQKNMGEVATRFRQQDRKIDVRVQLAEPDRDSIEKLMAAVVRVDELGRTWTLADFVTEVDVREGPAEIRRVDQRRAAIVSANLAGLDLGRVAADLEADLLREIDVPPEFDVEVVGQKKEMERSRASLLGALLLAIFLVYVVMASQFESLVQPFIILFTIPLAGVGVLLTLWITGTPLSIMAFIGMIMLAGIVVNNAIVLVDQINRLRGEGVEVDVAIVEAGRRRLRPILMTTFTTVLAMIPLTGIVASIPHDAALDAILGTGQGAEIRAPMALTVIGGMSSSTILTLIVIPVVYSLVIRPRRSSTAVEHE